MTDQPVRGDKAATALEHPEHFGHQRVLIGDVHQAVLGKHHIETGRRKRERTGGDLDQADAGINCARAINSRAHASTVSSTSSPVT